MNERWKRARLIIAGVVAALLLPVPWLMAARRHPTSAVVQSRTVIAPPAPPLHQEPAPRFEAPPVIQEPSPFTEQVTTREMPEVVVDDRREWPRVPGALWFYAEPFTPRALEFTGETGLTSISLPAGEYRYELRANRYWRDRLPDQSGRFRCRKYRRYIIRLLSVAPEQWSPHADLGDP